jgi:hypothetical protein
MDILGVWELALRANFEDPHMVQFTLNVTRCATSRAIYIVNPKVPECSAYHLVSGNKLSRVLYVLTYNPILISHEQIERSTFALLERKENEP